MSFTNQYINPSPTVTSYQRFPAEYFSGANVSIYFNGVWIDELQSIAFAMQENVQPIHGYASYTADAFAHGNRIVQGQFSINFKGPHYLIATIRELELAERGKQLKSPGVGEDNVFGQRIDPQSLINVNYDADTWQRIADSMQVAMWGISAREALNTEEQLTSNPVDTYFYRRWNGQTSQLRDTGIDIAITYGNIANGKSLDPGSTTMTIVGVHLTGVSQAIGPNAEPIAEQYSFMAKDIAGSVKTYVSP